MADVEPAPPGIDALRAVSALGERTRRALYDVLVANGGWVSRDDAAEAVGLERGTAAHHLDLLAKAGLLDVEYRRLSGREGPGAGRPSKLYRRARQDLKVSLPPRDYHLAGRLLAQAVERSRADGVDAVSALDEAASAHGRQLAHEIRARLADAGGVAAKRTAIMQALAAQGFEPRHTDDGTIVLRNCPFHQLSEQYTELICGMNLCMLSTAVDDIGDAGLEPALEPEEGYCCVKLRPVSS